MATNEEIVAKAQQLYVSYYGRPADPEGLAFWIENFTNSDNVDQALVDFGTSVEYLAIIAANPTTPELINQLYQFMFNRDADAEGLAFYTDLLDSGAASLASIALDIANGATGDDITIIDNKIAVANGFTADVEANNSLYQSSDIAGAQGVLAVVDASAESVAAGEAASTAFVAALPQTVPGGEYTLDEDNSTGDYQAATGAVTVILDGDSDEANFNVTLSAFNDTVVLEEFQTAQIADTQGGIDTLDTSEHGGTATVNLLAGTFNMQDGAETFIGTISGVENVIGTDEDDAITGDNNDNWITGGDGNDTLKGGIGDDYFVFEDEGQVGGTADGQTGNDTAVFTADEVDLSLVADSHLAVENLMLTNIDDEDEVTLTLAAAGSVNIGTDSFSAIMGSDAVDTVQVAGDINVAAVTLVDVEVLATIGNANTVTINSGTTGLALVGNAGAATTNNGILALSGGGTFDTSMMVLSGFRSYQGTGNGTSVFENLVVNQAAVDSALNNAETPAGAALNIMQERYIFMGLNDAVAKVGNDVITLNGNVDFTGFYFDSNLAFNTLEFGQGHTVLFNDLGGTSVTTITGTTTFGVDDTLVVTPGSTAQNYAGVEISDVETLLIDVTSGNEGVNVTIDEDSLSGVEQMTGEIDLIITTSTATAVVDLADIVVTEGIDLSSATGVESVSVTQSVLDGFGSLGANGAATAAAGLTLGVGGLALVMGGDLSIDSSAIPWYSSITVKGSSDDDSLTVDGTVNGTGTLTNEELVAGYSVVLGAGNDTLITGAAGAVLGNVDLGSGDNTLIGVVGGSLDLTDHSAKVLGANDGTNTVIGLVAGNIQGGDGSDNVSVGGALGFAGTGLFPVASDLDKGDDSWSGIALGGLTLGSGDDTYTSVGEFQSASPTVAGLLPISIISGGSGNDTFNINNSNSTVNGGSGNDVFTLSALAFGATIQDLNVGQKDVFQIDLVGSEHSTTVAVTDTGTKFGSMTNTFTFTTSSSSATTTTVQYTWMTGGRTFSHTGSTTTGTTSSGTSARTLTAPSGTTIGTNMTGAWVATTSQTFTSQTVTITSTSTTMSGTAYFASTLTTMTGAWTGTMASGSKTFTTGGGSKTGVTTSTTSVTIAFTTATAPATAVTGTFTVLTDDFGFVSGTTDTTTSALAAALTEAGGLRVLNGQGDLVTIAPGAALGTTVAFQTLGSSATLLSWLTHSPSHATFAGIGTTSSSNVQPSLADTTYVVFAVTASLTSTTSANFVAFLVTANTAAAGTVTVGEVSTVTIASIASDGLSAADVILI